MSTDASHFIGTVVHLTRGQKYLGAVLVTGIALAPNPDGGLHLRTREASPVPAITGEWLPECTTPTMLDDIHTTETAAKAAIKARRAAAKAARAAAGPARMAATDGNYMAMLVGATRVRTR